MKKNISINISGIIFHIEEDGYEQLKSYLDSVHRYFASYDGSEEIIADIESRIAELFLAKLKNSKQVITAEDVLALIKTMGDIKDFQSVEEEEPVRESTSSNGNEPRTSSESGEHKHTEPKRLYRDMQRKLLGGVASGLANYINVDPLWVRLLFVILLFSSGIFFIGFGVSLSGFAFLAYIIGWIAIPASYSLEEDQQLKKLFRNPDQRVLGGVASGVASYFNIDVAIVRVLFVVLIIPGGIGLIAYLVLWIITPEANSLTARMQMQGEPVTISNIENRVKQEQRNYSQDENIFSKIFLFPFRVIGAVFTFLGKAVGPIVMFFVDAIRVILGLVFTLVGISLMFSVLLIGGVMLGLYTGENWMLIDTIPVDLLVYAIPSPTALALFVAAFIPALGITLAGISAVSNRGILPAPVSAGLLIVWVFSLVAIAFTVPNMVRDFDNSSTITQIENYELNNKTLVVKLNDADASRWSRRSEWREFNMVSLKLKPSEDQGIRLVREFESYGSNRTEAERNISMVSHKAELIDSVLTFDKKLNFKSDAIFRMQNLELSLYVPMNQPFVLDPSINVVLVGQPYQVSESATWVFEENGLRCITCSEQTLIGTNTFGNLIDFDKVLVNHVFEVTIDQGEVYSVRIDQDHALADQVKIYKSGNTLHLNMDDKRWLRKSFRHSFDRVPVYITMPSVDRLEINGASEVRISDFKQAEMEIRLSGAGKLQAEIEVEDLNITMSGASDAHLRGSGSKITARVSGASDLKAKEFTTEYANITAQGASKARVSVKDDLKAKASGASKIWYKGDPRTDVRSSGASNISKE